MSESTALAIYGQFDNLQRAAVALHKSGYFKDLVSEAQAVVKVMAGAELGLPPFASMTGIHIVQGKPVLGANLLATLIHNSGRYSYRIKQCDSDACILVWYENGQAVGESGFTMKEAQAAGLTGKDNWKKYPSDMLFARAISRGARRFAPGVFGGSAVYTADELDSHADSQVIDGEATVIEHPATNGKPGLDHDPDYDPLLAATEAPAVEDFVKHAALTSGPQAISFKNGRLADWVDFVTGGDYQSEHAPLLLQTLDNYCNAVADSGNRHTTAAANKAKADYQTLIAAKPEAVAA
jgi:hypothetical protein